MAKAACNHTRGLLLAEAIRVRAEHETGGDERLARYRIHEDITASRVAVTAETASGALFEQPPGYTWATATYNFRTSRAWWVIGDKPVWARWAGKVKPRETRRRIVAYCVRVSVPLSGSETPGSRQPVRIPRQPQQEAIPKATIKDQVVAAFGQMKTKSTKRSDLAKELARQIGKPDSWGYIRKELSEWGLWKTKPRKGRA